MFKRDKIFKGCCSKGVIYGDHLTFVLTVLYCIATGAARLLWHGHMHPKALGTAAWSWPLSWGPQIPQGDIQVHFLHLLKKTLSRNGPRLSRDERVHTICMQHVVVHYELQTIPAWLTGWYWVQWYGIQISISARCSCWYCIRRLINVHVYFYAFTKLDHRQSWHFCMYMYS